MLFGLVLETWTRSDVESVFIEGFAVCAGFRDLDKKWCKQYVFIEGFVVWTGLWGGAGNKKVKTVYTKLKNDETCWKFHTFMLAWRM